MLRGFILLLAAMLASGCSAPQIGRFALEQNPSQIMTLELYRSRSSSRFVQSYPGLVNRVEMDRRGNLLGHELTAGSQVLSSRRAGSVLILPAGQIPSPDSLYHLSALAVMPLLLPKIQSLPLGSSAQVSASTAPSGDLVSVEWLCTARSKRERRYLARYEVTTADLRYANQRGRWALQSAEYRDREYVQRWNRIPRR
jgi:hypothetical protein